MRDLRRIDPATGKSRWFHDVEKRLDGEKRLDAVVCGSPGGLVYTQAEPIRGENNWRPTLVWVDPATGQTKARTTLEQLKHERPKFGPLFAAGERRFAFFGRGEQDPNREIVELVPKSTPLVGPGAGATFGRWNPTTDLFLQAAAAQVLPEWTLLGGRVDCANRCSARMAAGKKHSQHAADVDRSAAVPGAAHRRAGNGQSAAQPACGQRSVRQVEARRGAWPDATC